ncbi:ABC-2 type transporter [Aquimixticola soesokkakensis]|uniref:Transport permease protein n=1 Tax=Aquimixticola soesokkakensis TaxID=1519096 RepID=A0A1Y5TMH3_9RHOB|nr:ABC transporter permease [Aquimixticola soesokkakensis]SLN63813.1 ABC-2 type transporter [Aquimixticola soesokkakensis]
MSDLMRELEGLRAIWWRDVRRMLTDKNQIVGGVSRPLLWVIVLGVGLNPWFRGEVYGSVRFVVPFTFVQFLFPAIILLNLLYASVQSAVSLIWDLKFGVLREVLVAPLSRATVLVGKILGGMTVALVHGALVLCVARAAGVAMTLSELVSLLGIMAALSFGLTAFGIVIALSLREFDSFGVFSNAVILPLYFTAGSVFPLDAGLSRAQTLTTYPQWLVSIVEVNPLTYVLDLMRAVVIDWHSYPLWYGVAVIVALDLGCLGLALMRFRRV